MLDVAFIGFIREELSGAETRVRFQVSNKDLALRPGQFGTIELSGAGSEALTIPMDAVIDTGRAGPSTAIQVRTHEGPGLEVSRHRREALSTSAASGPSASAPVPVGSGSFESKQVRQPN